MTNQLVRMLSTGRNGTNFMARLFADQGYLSFHEDLYTGEPIIALHHYLGWLGDQWKADDPVHYKVKSSFVRPYVREVKQWMKKKNSRVKNLKDRVVVHSDHRLTHATPLVLRELAEQGIAVKHLILIRNPLRTIHAIYVVEGKSHSGLREYRIRPQSFYSEEGVLGAAQIWANTYRMIADHVSHFGEELFYILQLEEFSNQAESAKAVFDFLELPFDAARFSAFTQQALAKPLRNAKQETERNSDLFRDPNYVIPESELNQIGAEIQDVLERFGRNWEADLADYKQFHAREKGQLGLS
jgi:hypothetical protein